MAQFEKVFESLSDSDAEVFYQGLEVFLDGGMVSEMVYQVFFSWCAEAGVERTLLVKSTAFPQAALRSLLRRTRKALSEQATSHLQV